MTSNSNLSPAEALLSILDSDGLSGSVSDVQADQAVMNFLNHLRSIHSRQKSKQWSERYVIDSVFGRTRKFNNDAERQVYCRVHLKVAIDELSTFICDLRGDNSGVITFSSIQLWKSTFVDYVYDLIGIVSFLQRDLPDYVYFRGGKSHTVHSWEVYNLAKGLAYQSAHWGSGMASLDHKVAQISSIGVLRQSLELRFTRLIAVYPIDKKGRAPKLRHGFHHDFVAANTAVFHADGFSFAELRPMYDWCSEIVHQAYQPYAWQISYAFRLAGRLLGSKMAQPTKAWSIANKVEILDVPAMQEAFEHHFLGSYEHGEWSMIRERPEALTPNWTSTMAIANGQFRMPINRKPIWKQFLARIIKPLLN